MWQGKQESMSELKCWKREVRKWKNKQFMERDQDERLNTGKNGRWSEEKKTVISKLRFSDEFPSCHAKIWKADLIG